MSSLRRPNRPKRRRSAWSDPAYKEKQESRDRVAKAIAKHFRNSPAPAIFVLPSHDALCAKTINRLVPNAVFYGTDYYRSVVEKIDAVDKETGKIVNMPLKNGRRIPLTIERYIEEYAGSLVFDAAFLDYKTDYLSKRQEIQDFATKMLEPTAVLAITVQRGETDLVWMIGQDLLKVVQTVMLEDHLEYDTNTPMLNVIFLLRR